MCDLFWRRGGGTLVLALLLGLAVQSPIQAKWATILFDDGFVVQGDIKRDSVVEFDKEAKDVFVIPKGHFYLDDYPRRVQFSMKSLFKTIEQAPPNEVRLINKNGVIIAPPAFSMPDIQEQLEAGAFKDNWERPYSFRCPRGTVHIIQRLGFLTPYFMRMEATKHFERSSAFYLTREFDLDTLRTLVTSHPLMKDSKTLKPEERLARRYKYVDFFAQAGHFDEAERELAKMRKDLPAEAERIERTLEGIGRVRSRDLFEQIKRRHLAGQYEHVNKVIADFPTKGVPDKTLADVRELKADHDAAREKLAQTRRFLTELPGQVEEHQRSAMRRLASAIRDDLAPDNVGRLESFLGQAAQAERLRKEGQATLSAAELLSLAATGWLLGSPSAETKPERALQLWAARDLILAYQKENSATARQKLLADYQARKDVVGLDEIMQLIPTLPPVEPAEGIDTKPVEVRVSGGKGDPAVNYVLQLPPEYHQGRSYPVLIVLHNGNEKAYDMVKRWSEAAAENGYILAAPLWQQKSFNPGYGYTEREQNTVLLTLRDLRRRFNIDSDRVFLFGLGHGGNMAWDVGLSHPDLFAGVLPMSGCPELFAERYWRNGQYLPFYVVIGDRAGDVYRRTRGLFENWLNRGYPLPENAKIQGRYSSLCIQYKGRGVEWFAGEVPNMIDWMRKKKRAFPLREAGTDGHRTGGGNEFQTMRHTDNCFYWISTSAINDRCVNSGSDWQNKVVPATLTARADYDSNEIYAGTVGVKQLTFWFARNSQGQSTINFDKPLTVYINLKPYLIKRTIAPSLAVLLEDLYQRNDRQRLFLAKIDFNL